MSDGWSLIFWTATPKCRLYLSLRTVQYLGSSHYRKAIFEPRYNVFGPMCAEEGSYVDWLSKHRILVESSNQKWNNSKLPNRNRQINCRIGPCSIPKLLFLYSTGSSRLRSSCRTKSAAYGGYWDGKSSSNNIFGLNCIFWSKLPCHQSFSFAK